jgi:diguanylate cyclase (GGDEF)-like protein
MSVGGDDDSEARTHSDLEQTIADGEQSESDLDQSLADADRHAAERDQRASDRDQEASDRDQAIIDHGETMVDADYERSRHARAQSTIDRVLSAQARSMISHLRDEAAARRDQLADERDKTARARDQLADSLDAEIERLVELDGQREHGELPKGMDILVRAAGNRKRAAASRAQAARDRELAARDREQAALDRATAAEELAREGVDHLTGALGRRAGLTAIQRGLDRACRADERLVVAFIDVDGLKEVNDTQGHVVGDQLLGEVAESIRSHLRPYDVIVRFGGDEFVCSLSDLDEEGARARFGEIATHLAGTAHQATITVGFAERQGEVSLDELIHRADEAMIAARRPGRLKAT